MYLQAIIDACVNITVAELCFEKKTKESVVKTLKKMLCKILSINLWKKNVLEGILWKMDKNFFGRLSRFWQFCGCGWGER